MKYLKISYIPLFILVFNILATVNSFAQPGPAGGPGPSTGPGTPYAGPPPCWPPPCIPIDGGVGILIAAGLALGGKKVYDMRKQNNKKADE